MTSSTLKDGWIGNALWSPDKVLLVYMPEMHLPERPDYQDNLRRMLDPVSPIDFLDDSLDRQFMRNYLET